MNPLLDVVVLTAKDAIAAARGGANRLEVVQDMTRGGLTPSPDVVAGICAVVSVPVRVMLRPGAGFTVTSDELDALAQAAAALRDAGASGFVFGFLTRRAQLDLNATRRVIEAIDGAPWTFHRAIDHACDPDAVAAALPDLIGLDTILTAGSTNNVEDGLPTLVQRRRTWQTDRIRLLAGGQLRPEHVPPLTAADICSIHVGDAVRERWERPVDAERVVRFRDLLAAPTGIAPRLPSPPAADH